MPDSPTAKTSVAELSQTLQKCLPWDTGFCHVQGEVVAALMVMDRLAVAVTHAPSTSWRVKSHVPTVVGVP